MEDNLEYELIEISFGHEYELPEEEMTWQVCEEEPSDGDNVIKIEYDADGVPMGRTRQEIKHREKIIKDFYAKWIAEHPNKAILNKCLNKIITIKFQSINETYNKAARSYLSTIAVFKLTEILENAELKEELIPKNNKNQKQYEKMLVMMYEDVKLIVGIQKSSQDHVQYSITVPRKPEG